MFATKVHLQIQMSIRTVEGQSESLPLTVLLYAARQLHVFGLRPLSLLQASGHRIVPSLAAIFVGSSGKTCSNSTPAQCQ
jgi:hypothetical protein